MCILSVAATYGICFAGGGGGSDSIPSPAPLISAITESRLGLWQIATLSFDNPAVNQWKMTTGHTAVEASYASGTDRNNPDPRDGDSDRCWSAGASTYTKYRSSTLWGHATYLNGKTGNVVWNETADRELLYPYLLADSIGGDLKREVYSFSGGYADHHGRWAWGARIGYEALLEYRDIDPRPKNVVGRLTLSAGGMFRFAGSYHAGLSINILKYKQTNEIDFKSEMGVDKIFHLTGMTSHYNRFAGEGLDTYYNGSRTGIDLNIYPSDGKGAFATASFSRFTFDNILTDLNKLPLASVWHNEFRGEAGWMSPGKHHFGGGSARITLYRRHGLENIFGDAASSIYPVIASNEMFADNSVNIKATGRWGVYFGSVNRLQVSVSPEWSHEVTAVIEPYDYQVLNKVSLTASVAGVAKIGNRWLLEGELSGKFRNPYDCRLSLTSSDLNSSDKEMAGLDAAVRGGFSNLSSRSSGVGISAGATRLISPRYALSLRGNWESERYANTLRQTRLNITLTLSLK